MSVWRRLDRVMPPVGARGAAAGHATRWALFVAVAVMAAVLFGGAVPSPHAVSARVTLFAGRFLGDLLLVGLFGITLTFYRPALYASVRAVSLFTLGLMSLLVVAAVVARGGTPQPELIPVALVGVLFSVLFDTRISVSAMVLVAILIGMSPPYAGTPALVVLLVGGVAAAFSVRVIRRRDQVYRSVLVTAAGYALVELALGLAAGAPLGEIRHGISLGAINSVISVALALMLLPPLEAFTGVDTYLKLLEWSDLNRPLMQRLSVEAPGTFAHTMRLANLAEAACTAIGANGLLARVGAYYHDIGKLVQPDYFVENQRPGANPHDALTPAASAAIIRDHVRRGAELADAHHVPEAARAFITEHHGTGQISYFLELARGREGPSVDPAAFAYPGPVPQTAETAICMLADGIEATAHMLHDATPKRIRDLIDYIVRQRIAEGQLRDAPLTLKQIGVVKEQFGRVLIGMYHHRVAYPSSGDGGAEPRLAPDGIADAVQPERAAALP